jgi:hypothetical protein
MSRLGRLRPYMLTQLTVAHPRALAEESRRMDEQEYGQRDIRDQAAGQNGRVVHASR